MIETINQTESSKKKVKNDDQSKNDQAWDVKRPYVDSVA